MEKRITASTLYNYVQCPRRVQLDFFGDPSKKDRVSAFVELLWERGNAFERETMDKLDEPFADLRSLEPLEKEQQTLRLMRLGEKIIYGGRIRTDTLVGEPDLLVQKGSGYVAGDIKSGAGIEGMDDESDGKLKRHYAVQLALYTDVLGQVGFLSRDRFPFIWDVHGQEVDYDLDTSISKRDDRSLWDLYQECLDAVIAIKKREQEPLAALCAVCKLCHWRSHCRAQLKQDDDLTLIPELGRAKRDVMYRHLKTVHDLAQADLNGVVQGKKTIFPRISAKTIRRFQARAALLASPSSQPYLKEPITFPEADIELFFDVETDPMRDCCYLHGFIERNRSKPNEETYHAFFADRPTEEQERKALDQALNFLRSRDAYVIYYYSHYERTTLRKLQKRFPDIASEEEIENLFSPSVAIDLYTDVVRKKTEWPTNDYSIKTLANYLGFKWRDKEPSGAASIEWYHRWVETQDSCLRQRILDYNEDDCIAMRVLLDALRGMAI
ncbi:conserved hypothetical protein [Desulfosarcina cetonica]|nr:conserved hypothetical protein [Desulfosarcina cetonica]